VRDAIKWLASLGLVETRPGPGTFVVEKHERRFIDSHPWSMQTSYYPMEFADLGAERLRSARDIVDVGNASDVKAQENTGNQSFRAKIRSTRLNQPDGSYEGKEHG
jgi:DNA-binding FadR family transcriptional regulator